MAKKNMKKCCPSLRRVFSNNNGFQVLMCHHAVRKDTHAGLQRILRHAMNYECGSAIGCNEWRLQRILRHAMNYGCSSAIGCNEWRLLMRHRAVRKDTHAGLQRILRCAMNHGCGSVSCAMNYGCWYAIARSHTLACNEFQVLVGHRAIRKDTHADMQRISAGDVTSYRQRRANGC